MGSVERLFHLNESGLVSFAGSILKNHEDAKDIVQEVFCECLSGQDKNLSRAYLFKAVRNRALNKKRASARFYQATERFKEYLEQSARAFFDPADSVTAYFNKLPPPMRIALILKIQQGLTTSEIADVLGIPEGTVKSRINSGLCKIRKSIKRDHNE
ncbi:MAG: sigma-70 family RNA polymerase sigma factor [Bacteriovoracaceae bacterium]|jgi:RNA polymerase sigma-70 factor, ECF subfamily|nr:sigma-70 family RNA polymerase sigma factor [Bacteriovoracaceae bacterium]